MGSYNLQLPTILQGEGTAAADPEGTEEQHPKERFILLLGHWQERHLNSYQPKANFSKGYNYVIHKREQERFSQW